MAVKYKTGLQVVELFCQLFVVTDAYAPQHWKRTPWLCKSLPWRVVGKEGLLALPMAKPTKLNESDLEGLCPLQSLPVVL
jgi:hypothetical protein